MRTIFGTDTYRLHSEERGNAIVIGQQMNIKLSTVHRAVDNAMGAEFIGAIKMYLE